MRVLAAFQPPDGGTVKMRPPAKAPFLSPHAFLEFFAEADVETAQGKKCHYDADEDQVTHKISAASELSNKSHFFMRLR